MLDFGRNRGEPEPTDNVVLIGEDGTAEIMPVLEVSPDRILAGSNGDVAIPVGDLKRYNGRRGAVYLIGADVDTVKDFRRIAELERSTVLRQITHYTPPPIDTAKPGMGKILLFGAIGIICILMFFVK